MTHCLRLHRQLFGAAVFLAGISLTEGQAPLLIYTDYLVNGFQDWGWGTRNLAATGVVHSGSQSISMTTVAWQALSFHHADFSTAIYSNLTFWANGGPTGGQRLQVYANFGTNAGPAFQVPALPANTWRQTVIPLSTLGVANVPDLSRLTLQLTSSGTTSTFYVDDLQLTAKPAPTLVHVNLNASQAVRVADSRWFGLNTAIWDSNFDTPTTVSLLREVGAQILRFPGGSLSDEYHWASNRSGTNTWQWATSFAKFVHVATNIGAQAMITVNYGTGTAAEAAGWVRHANVTNRFGFKHWEIGNEVYGTWETDANTYPNDAFTYATRARDYFQQMKAADPTIKVGVVVTPGEDSGVNGYTSHPATNALTGQVHYGWTPVLLTTLRSLGVAPDFVIHHRYPEYTDKSLLPACADSDALLLQSSSAWTSDAADLRAQITGYFGAGGTNIEILCTENNSDAGTPGRQSTSLVNGLYYADSLAQLMQTEINALVWWDLRNGSDTTGSFDASLYGWRTVGDLGMVGNLSTRYPPFYAAKLMHLFAQPGDTVLSAASDYQLISAYASRRPSGAVSLLVLNKDTLSSFATDVAFAGFTPSSSATLLSYGIPQDEAARTNAAPQAQDISTNQFSGAGTNFSFAVPPLSLTLFQFVPTPPSLVVVTPGSTGGQLVFQLQGQPAVRYVLQSSADLSTWTSVLTNTLAGATQNFTNPVPSGPTAGFWRTVWQP